MLTAIVISKVKMFQVCTFKEKADMIFNTRKRNDRQQQNKSALQKAARSLKNAEMPKC